MIIDDIWEGAYKGLYGEVVTEDVYRLRSLPFIPDIIFDLGANVGTFSRFARELFPNAVIVAIEPDANNLEYFYQFNNPDELRIQLERWAIGKGQCFRCEGAINGAHEVYVTEQLGFKNIELQKCEVPTCLLDTICEGISGRKYILKIDIEGAETAIFEHNPSMDILRNSDYIAMELHYHALEGSQIEGVKEFTLDTLDSLKETHHTEYLHPMFYAIKK